jgi:RNA polymerase sigma factor (sigma-70 family)
VAGRDEAAFAALLRRHGPAVRAACRRVLGDGPDADDAFQATFLVLWQHGHRVRRGRSVGSWLYGVAHRVACQARSAAVRRSQVESRAAAAQVAPAEPSDLSWREACAVLHEELDRLPERYRMPLLLCYLEGKSRDEAARALGWSLGALKGRLERGRTLLRARLARRGIGLSAGLLAGLAGGADAGGVPWELMRTTAQAAADGLPSAAVAALTRGAVAAGRGKLAAVVALAVGLLAAGAGARLLAPAPADPPHGPVAQAEPRPADDAGEVTFRGRVLDPDGRPVAGARVYLFVRRYLDEQPPIKDPLARWEEVTVGGEKSKRLRHPKLDAFRAKHGTENFDPAAHDPVKDRDAIDELMAIYADIFGGDPRVAAPVRARSGADGRWEFRVARRHLHSPLHADVMLAAWAAGYGPAWLWPADGETFADVPLRLVKDVPVEGRLLDLQGRPVAGAAVKLGPVHPLDEWLALVGAAARRDTQMYNELLHRRHLLGDPNAYFFPHSATTDKDGRFRVAGIGADRAVHVEVRSDTAGHDEFTIMTRPGPGPTVATGDGTGVQRSLRTYGVPCDYVPSATRRITGTVRDKATGKAMAGVQVAGWGPAYVDDRSDGDGKYRLQGLGKAESYRLVAWPRGAEPYMVTSMTVDDTFGLGDLTAEFEMVRGVWLQGKVTDGATGRPVGGAQLRYSALKDNPHLAVFAFNGNPVFRDNPRLRNVPVLEQAHTMTGADGSFRLAVLAGKGVLGVTVHDGPYPAEQWAGPKVPGRPSEYVPYPGFRWTEFDTLHTLDVPAQDKPVTLDISMMPGRTIPGTVTDPDGKPLTGVVIHGLTAREFRPPEPLPTAAFTVTGLAPGRPRLLLAEHPGRKLGGLVRVEGDAAGPLALRLEPTGGVTGRLLDARTQTALARKPVTTLFADAQLNAARGTRVPAAAATDGAGRFRLDGLVPGVAYRVYVQESGMPVLSTVATVTVRPGEVKDLGDVSVKLTQIGP